MKVLIWFFGVLLFSARTLSQTNSADSLWIVENYYKMERSIPMRDGVKLFTSMYVPKDSSEKHPILITRTPYSCYPYGEGNWQAFWNNYKKYYFRAGYIIVIQDVRGLSLIHISEPTRQ